MGKIEYYANLKWFVGGCPNMVDKTCNCKDGLCMAPQKRCIRNKQQDEKVIKAVYHEHHMWTLVKESKLKDLVNNYNSFIMEILNDYPKKVYFDIDGTEPEKLNLENIKLIINKYFPDEEMSISGYENDKKKSYHIILHNLILKNDSDLNLLKKVATMMKINDCEYIDNKVYTKNRAMKCINQSKNKDVPQQMIISNNNESNHYINSFFTGKEKGFIYDIPENIVQYETEIMEIKEPLKLSDNFSKNDLQDSKKLLLMCPCEKNYSHSYTWKIALFCASNGLSFNDFWEWAQQKDSSQHRKIKWETYHWDVLLKSEYKFTKKGLITMLSLYYPELANIYNDSDDITNKFINSLNISQQYINRIGQEHFETDKKALIFNIGMGGGKTTQTVEYLEKTNSKFIWIAPRQALVMNTFQRFKDKKMNVLNYLDCGSTKDAKRKNINNADKILLESESLNKLDSTTKYDVLVIDEIETVLKNWDSETHIKNDINNNWLNFKTLFKNCKKIILLDAFTTSSTLQFLEALDIDYITYGSNYKPPKKIIVENTGYEKTINKICNDLDNNKKLYIFHAFKSSSKSHYSIEELKSVILEKCEKKHKILVYHGDMCDSKKKSLYDVNDEWDKYDCILTTSSITVGVNYEGSKYDKIYLMVAGCVNNVRDIIQTSMRIRKTNDNIIELFFFDKMDKEVYENPDYYKTSNDNLYISLINNIAIEKQSNFVDSFYKFCSLTNYETPNLKKVSFNKTEKFINELYESKFLIPYDKIKTLNNKEALDIELNNVWCTNATQNQKIELNKYYFDIKYKHLNNEDKCYIWDNRQMKFFDNYEHEFFTYLNKDNNINNIFDLDLKKIIVSDDTNKYIEEQFKLKIKNPKQKIIKIINSILGQVIDNVSYSSKSKSSNYKFSYMSEELNDIYKKRNTDIFKIFNEKNEYN